MTEAVLTARATSERRCNERSKMKNALGLTPKLRRSRKVVPAISQAERARTLAASCPAPLIAELLEIHAQICERNALKAKGAKG
jgi:tellurite resistance protein